MVIRMLIKKLRIVPDLEEHTEFEKNKNNVHSIALNDDIITIKFEKEDHITSIEIPIKGLIKIKFNADFNWDGKFISIQGNESIYYKRDKEIFSSEDEAIFKTYTTY